MPSPYILRSGVSGLSDLVDGAEAKIDPGTKKVYYVNGITWSNGFAAGNDGNQGDVISKPFMSLTQALSVCDNEGNDAIIVLDYWQPTNETWPVAVSKSLVHILGIRAGPHRDKWAQMSAVGSFPCIDVTGSNLKIEGLGFTPNASSPCVTFDDGCSNVWIHNCLMNSGTYGLQLASGDTGYGIIFTYNTFISALSSGGIYVADDPAFLEISNNFFDRHTGISIDVEAGAGAKIVDNRFALKANTQGLAITLASAVSRAFVDGNSAGFGTATTTSPYEDEGTVTTNNWGLNYLGGTAIAPA